MIVLDATVVVKLVTFEPGAEVAASRIMNETDRIAPAWVRLEVASALAKKVRRGAMSLTDAKQALDSVEPLLTETVDPLNLIDDALSIACRAEHAVYDCMYLALAIRTDCILLTHDKKLAVAGQRVGLAHHIELLA